jgi:hypothetical protein
MPEKSCPLGWFCDKCLWHTHLRGLNPQTGQEIDQHGCSIAFLPMLLIENSQQQRQTAAAVESSRNELVKTISRGVGAFLQAQEPKGDLLIRNNHHMALEKRDEPN